MHNEFTIDSKDYRKDGCLITLFGLWGCGVAGFTGIGLAFEFYPFVWFGIISLPPFLIWAFLTRNKVECIQLTSEGLEISNNVWGSSKILIKRNRLIEVSLEYVDSNGEPDKETIMTLNIWDRSAGFRRRTIIAYWAHPSEKDLIYKRLLSFLMDGGFEMSGKNEYVAESESNRL